MFFITYVIINTILDPIFIYVFDWGIRGAAIATIIAQVISLIWQLKILSDKNELLHLKKGIYQLKGKIVKNIIAIGLSPFCMNVASCFIVIFINKGLKQYDGDLAIGAYGIVNRLVFICVMIVMGITQGMQPIAGYNYGAQQYQRVNQVLKLSIWGATAITTLTFLVGELIPEVVVSLFTTDEGYIKLLPKHRYGKQSDLPFAYPPIALPASVSHHLAKLLGSIRHLVEYAYQ